MRNFPLFAPDVKTSPNERQYYEDLKQAEEDLEQAAALRAWSASKGGRCAIVACLLLALLPVAGGALWLL